MEFWNYLESCYIDHHLTFTYHAIERGKRSIKEVLLKINKVDKKTLAEVILNYNNIVAPDGSGSPVECFLMRGIRTNLPIIFRKSLKTEDLIQIQTMKQTKLAEKKGRQSTDVFQVGDCV